LAFSLHVENRCNLGRVDAGYCNGIGAGQYRGRPHSHYVFQRRPWQRQRLSILSGPKTRSRATTIDLVGTASNLRSAADIIGTYNAADPEAGILKRAKIARFENGKGVVLEIRAVNLGRWSSLNLSGMTIKALGWQPPE
jgi:hypothetical protein